MHDPYYVGSFELDDFDEHFKFKRDKYGVMTIQGLHHAVRLRKKGTLGDDQLTADRLKEMCGLLPLNIGMLCLGGEEYFMIEAPFTCEEALEIQPVTSLTEWNSDWASNTAFRLEVCKIILFRWMIGCQTNFKDIEVWNEWPISASERKMTLDDLSPKTHDMLRIAYSDVLQEAMYEVSRNFDFTDLRGCVARKGRPMESLFHVRIDSKYGCDPRQLVCTIEEKLDMLETMTSEEFLSYYEEKWSN